MSAETKKIIAITMGFVIACAYKVAGRSEESAREAVRDYWATRHAAQCVDEYLTHEDLDDLIASAFDSANASGMARRPSENRNHDS